MTVPMLRKINKNIRPDDKYIIHIHPKRDNFTMCGPMISLDDSYDMTPNFDELDFYNYLSFIVDNIETNGYKKYLCPSCINHFYEQFDGKI